MKIIENRTGLIYCWQYKDGRCYVGQTFTDQEKVRIWQHKKYNTRHKFHDNFHDLMETDFEGFIYTVLERDIPTPFDYDNNVYDRALINEREKYWIEQKNSCAAGFNKDEGGNFGYSSGFGWAKGKKRPDQSRKMSGEGNPMYGKVSPRRGKKAPEDTCKRISEGKKNPSQETRDKMSAWQKGKPKSEKAKAAMKEAWVRRRAKIQSDK